MIIRVIVKKWSPVERNARSKHLAQTMSLMRLACLYHHYHPFRDMKQIHGKVSTKTFKTATFGKPLDVVDVLGGVGD